MQEALEEHYLFTLMPFKKCIKNPVFTAFSNEELRDVAKRSQEVI